MILFMLKKRLSRFIQKYIVPLFYPSEYRKIYHMLNTGRMVKVLVTPRWAEEKNGFPYEARVIIPNDRIFHRLCDSSWGYEADRSLLRYHGNTNEDIVEALIKEDFRKDISINEICRVESLKIDELDKDLREKIISSRDAYWKEVDKYNDRIAALKC